MPAKAMCPQCGQKTRGASHLCDPKKIAREGRRSDVLQRLAAQQK